MVNLSGENGKRYMKEYLEFFSPYVDHIFLSMFSETGGLSWRADLDEDELACELSRLSLTSCISGLDLQNGKLMITTRHSLDGSTNIDADVIESIVAARRRMMGR